jgi:hypothetical protein
MQKVLGAQEECKTMLSLFSSYTHSNSLHNTALYSATSTSPSARVGSPSGSMFEDAMKPNNQTDPVTSCRGNDLNRTSMASSPRNSGHSATSFKQTQPGTSNANVRKASDITSSLPVKSGASTHATQSFQVDGDLKEYPNGDACLKIEKINLDSRQGTSPIFGWALATNG